VEAAGGVAEDVEGRSLAPATEPDLRPEVHGSDTARKRGPRRCKVCGELGHDRRTCPSVAIIPDAAADGEVVKTAEKYSETIPPAEPNPAHEARIAEFRRLAVYFPALAPRARSVALLVAQGYDPGAIAGDLQIKRFDVYQLMEWATTELRAAEERRPTPAPVLPSLRPPAAIGVEKEEQSLPPARRPCRVCGATDHDGRRHRFDGKRAADFSPKPPTVTQEHREEPEIAEEAPPAVAQPRPSRSTGVGRGRGRCRRCGQPGHRVTTCPLDESDIAAARLQDIAAACVRLGLSAAPPPRAPLPIVEAPIAPEIERPTWDPADLDAIAEMVPGQPEPPPPPPPPPEPEPERLVKVSDIKDRHRSRTMKSPYRLTVKERRAGELLEVPEDLEMPLTRGECQADPGRPCPWVRCKAHLFLDVNEETGAIKLNFPHLEVWEMKETCSNDVADRGGHTLEEVGALVNLTRERVRQIETGAGRNRAAKKIAEDVEFIDHDDESPLASAIG